MNARALTLHFGSGIHHQTEITDFDRPCPALRNKENQESDEQENIQ